MKKSRQIKKSAFTLAEVPEAQHHIGHWSNASCHCEERSDVAIAKPIKRDDIAITTSNAAHSPRNDRPKFNVLSCLRHLVMTINGNLV